MITYNGTSLPEIGTVMPDGTIYCGISAHQKPLYAAPNDEGEMDWDDALKAAKESTACGHKDWRLPDLHELDLLYTHREKIGGFSPRWYWSSSEYDRYLASHQHFEGGFRTDNCKGWAGGLVRSVRG